MTSAHLYHYHLDAAEEGTTYGVIAIAGSQSNAGNLFSGTFNASGKVASWERSMRSLRLPRYIGESNMCDYFSFSPGKPGRH